MYIIIEEDKVLKSTNFLYKYGSNDEYKNLFTLNEASDRIYNHLDKVDGYEINWIRYVHSEDITKEILKEEISKTSNTSIRCPFYMERIHVINLDSDIDNIIHNFRPNILGLRFKEVFKHKILEMKQVLKRYRIDKFIE
tara:strand:- start:19828 stop:20244 length:417 start_codon:yes stop_codon:yes gene_type:complete